MIKIFFDGNEIDSNKISGLKVNHKLFNGFFCLGSVSSKEVSLEIAQSQINSVPYNVVILDNDENMFNLIVDEVTEKNSFFYNMSLVDKMISLEFKYDSSELIEKNKSITLKEMLEDICNKIGLEIADITWINNKSVSWYNNTITARQYVSYIAEMQGCYAIIGKDGKLYFRRFEQKDYSISIDNVSSYKIGDYHKITRVVYQTGTLKFDVGNNTGNTLYISSNNVFVENEEEIRNIYNVVNGLEFYSISFGNCPVNSDIEAGDIINFNDGVNDYPFITELNMSYYGRWAGKYEIEVATKQQEETKVISDNEKIKSLEIEVNRDKNTINQLIKDVYSEDGTINDSFSNLYMDIDKIVSSVQKAGGNNLIMNSVGFAGESSWDVEKDNEDTSILNQIVGVELKENGLSGGAFMLNGIKISQKIKISSNTKYSFGCKVCKSASKSAYIKIYNEDNIDECWMYELPYNSELRYVEYTFNGLINITSNNLVVEFYGEYNSNFIITDSVLKQGEYASSWTQANGEILNTNVNVNVDGVLVKSLQYELDGRYTVISPIEFAGYAKINGTSKKVFTLNGDTTVVEKLRVYTQFAMTPLKIVPITTGSDKGWAIVTDSGGA